MNDRLSELDASESASLLSMADTPVPSQGGSRAERTEEASKKPSLKKSLKKKVKKISSRKKEQSKQRLVKVIDKRQESSKLMDDFYAQIESLGKTIQSIDTATNEIRCIRDKILLGSRTSQDERQYNKKMCTIVSNTDMTAKQVQLDLRQIKEETDSLLETRKLIESDIRFRKNLHAVVSRKFLEEIGNYQKAKQEYKIQSRERISRQVKYVQPDATEEDIDHMLHSGEDRDAFYQRVILTHGTINAQINKVHYDVTEKHKAIVKIEQSVTMIHEMFLELAFLTEEQGIQIDNIHHNTKTAGDYVEQGNEEIYESIQVQKKMRKRRRRIILIVGVITIIVIVVITL